MDRPTESGLTPFLRKVSTNSGDGSGPSGDSFFVAGSKSNAPFSATTRSKRSIRGKTRIRSGSSRPVTRRSLLPGRGRHRSNRCSSRVRSCRRKRRRSGARLAGLGADRRVSSERRDAGADLDRPEGIGDVIDPDAGVLIGGEDQPRALKRAGPVLVDIVRAEMAADRDIVAVVRQRERCDADRVRLDLIVEHPDRLETVLHIVEHRFVEDDEQISVWQGQAVVRPAAERRRPDPTWSPIQVAARRRPGSICIRPICPNRSAEAMSALSSPAWARWATSAVASGSKMSSQKNLPAATDFAMSTASATGRTPAASTMIIANTGSLPSVCPRPNGSPWA